LFEHDRFGKPVFYFFRIMLWRRRSMSEAVVDHIVAVLPPLLESLEALGCIARHLNPPDFDSVMEAAGTPDQALQAVRPRLTDWPDEFAAIRTALETASGATLAAFEGLRAVQHANGDLVAVFRALRHAARAQEKLYPLAANCRRSVASSSIPPCAKTPSCRRASRSRQTKTPGSFTTTTNPAAVAASHSTCRNITPPSVPGRW